ncbi:MAG: HAMP domain-containing protein [bacterium]|nr:HAMP domain-containing protein [bacterium]
MNVRFWKKSLVARLVFYFLLLSLLTVSLLGSIAFSQARDALQESILDRLRVAATLKEDALNQWVNDQIQTFLLFARYPLIQVRTAVLLNHGESEPEYQAAYTTLSGIMTLAEEKAEWQEVLVLSDKAKILLSTDKSHEGDHRILDRYFTEGRRETYVQRVYPSPITFIPTMTIATPLPDGTGERAGVLAMHLSLERMDKIVLERTGLGAGSESYLVDRFNVFISGEGFGREEFPRGVHSVGIDAALEGTNGSGRYVNYRGVPVLGVYRWIEELDLALLTEMPQREAFAPARRLASVILSVGLVAAVLLTVGIYLLARRIARPVLKITKAAVQVADGDLTSRAPVLTEDEIGVLAHTFNHMTERLRALYEDLEQEIAERKRTEEERKALIAELEAKNAELERFTYTVSHDLKSPMVTIRCFLGLLEKDIAQENSARMEQDIKMILSASETMQRLLDELLELSRIGRLVNPSEDISLEELAREAIDLVTGQIAEHGVDVVVAPDLPTVYGDRLRLLELLQNLIENAVKFMGTQAEPRVVIGASRDGKETVCYVRDNGMGIDPQYHEKIFGLFDRLNPSSEGTGIGLALVKRIVESHGGRIWIESEGEGEGATFYFSLPTEETSAQPEDP